MSETHMNIDELTRFLGQDYRKTCRMAQRGEIPCRKVGGQFRFNRLEVTQWLQQQLLAKGGNNGYLHAGLARMDAGITAHRQADPQGAIIAELLREELICPSLKARTKNSVLRELVRLAQRSGLLYDDQALLEALIQREQLGSTAMGGGIAIPHPRRPLPYAIAEPILVVAITPQGIGYGGPDGGTTDVFFMTCSQDDRHHLHVLARLCRILDEKGFGGQLRQAKNAREITALLTKRESAIISE